MNIRKLFAATWRVSAGGDPGHLPQPMRMGPSGFFINCAGCDKEFESRGLRCCSKDCERRARDRQDNAKAMAEVGMEAPTKRICEAEGCGRAIPRWRNGRAVSKAARFCQPSCSDKTRRKMKKATECPADANAAPYVHLDQQTRGAAEDSERTPDVWIDFPPDDAGVH